MTKEKQILQSGTKKNKYMNKKKNLPTQDNVKRLMEQTLKNILSCVGGVYYNKYKLKLERKRGKSENKS